jgi:hypothetical protein
MAAVLITRIFYVGRVSDKDVIIGCHGVGRYSANTGRHRREYFCGGGHSEGGSRY